MAGFDTFRIRRRLGWLLGCALIALTVRAQAEVVPDLYAASVPVAEQSQAELQRAAAAGLREIAVRISGRSSAANDPNLAPLFANAMHYLDQYRYERNAATDMPWLARLRFGAALIDNTLRAAGVPVWGNNRPALQVWLVLDDGRSRNFVDAASPLADALREQFQRRGLVLHFPPDFSAATPDDIWQMQVTKLLDNAKTAGATAAEHADGYLIGRISQVPGGSWLGSWMLAINGQQFSAEGEGDSLPTFLAPTLDRLVDNFSVQYAVAANTAAEGFVLRITGIANFDDYAAAMNYLRHLGLIKAVSPVVLRDDEMLLQLKVEGSTEQLARQLALESRLTPEANDANTLKGTNTPLPATLSYRWSNPQKGTGTLKDTSTQKDTSTLKGTSARN